MRRILPSSQSEELYVLTLFRVVLYVIVLCISSSFFKVVILERSEGSLYLPLLLSLFRIYAAHNKN